MKLQNSLRNREKKLGQIDDFSIVSNTKAPARHIVSSWGTEGEIRNIAYAFCLSWINIGSFC